MIYDFSIKGGAQRVGANVVNALDESGYHIKFISMFNSKGGKAYPINDRIEYTCLIDRKGRIKRDFFNIIKRLKKETKIDKYAYIIGVGYSSDLACSIVSIRNNISFIHWEHTSMFNKMYNEDFTSKIYRFVGIKRAAKIVVLTEENKDAVVKKYSIPDNKVKVIYNWVEESAISKLEYDTSSKKLITIGRADPVKGFGRLLDIATKLKVQMPGWQWEIWGDFDNDYGRMIIDKVSELNIQDFVKIMGTTDCVYEKLSKASIFLMTSFYEGLPMVLLEAQANNLPIVAFDIKTGPRDIVIDSVNGYLIENNNCQMYINRVVELAQNTDRRIEFAKHSQDQLWKFRKEVILNEWKKTLS